MSTAPAEKIDQEPTPAAATNTIRNNLTGILRVFSWSSSCGIYNLSCNLFSGPFNSSIVIRICLTVMCRSVQVRNTS